MVMGIVAYAYIIPAFESRSPRVSKKQAQLGPSRTETQNPSLAPSGQGAISAVEKPEKSKLRQKMRSAFSLITKGMCAIC